MKHEWQDKEAHIQWSGCVELRVVGASAEPSLGPNIDGHNLNRLCRHAWEPDLLPKGAGNQRPPEKRETERGGREGQGREQTTQTLMSVHANRDN